MYKSIALRPDWLKTDRIVDYLNLAGDLDCLWPNADRCVNSSADNRIHPNAHRCANRHPHCDGSGDCAADRCGHSTDFRTPTDGGSKPDATRLDCLQVFLADELTCGVGDPARPVVG